MNRRVLPYIFVAATVVVLILLALTNQKREPDLNYGDKSAVDSIAHAQQLELAPRIEGQGAGMIIVPAGTAPLAISTSRGDIDLILQYDLTKKPDPRDDDCMDYRQTCTLIAGPADMILWVLPKTEPGRYDTLAPPAELAKWAITTEPIAYETVQDAGTTGQGTQQFLYTGPLSQASASTSGAGQDPRVRVQTWNGVAYPLNRPKGETIPASWAADGTTVIITVEAEDETPWTLTLEDSD